MAAFAVEIKTAAGATRTAVEAFSAHAALLATVRELHPEVVRWEPLPNGHAAYLTGWAGERRTVLVTA